jgi:hypothetical protein
MPSTFHGTTIGNHDLEIVDSIDVAMSFSGNQNDDLLMLDVTD